MSWRNDLEIIGHHAKTGGVWAGDQIDKVALRRLRAEGYIRYDANREVYVLTKAGERTWARWKLIYPTWEFAKRVQWRISKASPLPS